MRRLTVTALGAAAMPWVLAVVIHLMPVVWLIEHGRWPSLTPMDDPGMASNVVFISLVLLASVGSFVGIAVCSGCIALVAIRSRARAVGLLVLCAAVWLGGIWMVRADPFGVFAWWMD